ncbi:PREDICTED: acyl-CoA:lysophosphatidylglycerol acyltransferase 1-like [Priapulus caudatus]|uniref:Acyl-CoA:lysophosphatidylglycerol acyltransferase 1-like n=1 Tax=Priapulus caudatus TaxID=37621 RepID=A0ABM1E4L8_PRICU|nr:PREDICTED: acyl-CoA:lysophosphatidylglycerol acyltransferase 1-like [Priapulus caudatus]XP_014667139.1 PREDICTED: acyl-CoA:lysophosphatidylglycerol acyltransferase 1-like [Priapulus caudatus]
MNDREPPGSIWQTVYLVGKVCLRFVYVLLNNLYCIPTYLLWMILLLPLKKVKPQTYWMLEGLLFRWLLLMVSMWIQTNGYKIVEVGEDISSCYNQECMVMVNHQSSSDVPMLFACLSEKAGGKLVEDMMWLMDKLFMWTNFGVVSLIHGDFFIQQGKHGRENQLQLLEKHLNDVYLPQGRKWLVLFPEGGFLNKRRERSQMFAKKNNLPHLELVALPRVGAMATILDKLAPRKTTENHAVLKSTEMNAVPENKRMKWLVDITVGYSNPQQPLDLLNVCLGIQPPCTTTMYYRRFPVDDIPREMHALTEWMYDRFVEKEKLLSHFYKMGVFPSNPSPRCRLMDTPRTIRYSYRHLIAIHAFFACSTYVHYCAIACLCRYVATHVHS